MSNSSGKPSSSTSVSVLPRTLGRPARGGRTTDEFHRRESSSRPSGTDKYLSDAAYQESLRRQFHPEDFHVAISDEQGHDTKIAGIRWHPMMANEMNMIIARGNFPIESVHDLIRWATFEGMKKLYELERKGGVPNYIARLAAINRIWLQSKHNREFEDSLKQVEEETNKLIASGKTQIAAMFVSDVLTEAKQIPQRTWREYYVGRLKEKFGQLLKSAQQSVKLNRRRDD